MINPYEEGATPSFFMQNLKFKKLRRIKLLIAKNIFLLHGKKFFINKAKI
ncbi:hypothetical protein HMPREF3229_00514 [Peptoniphilus harei]|uniref:Uncharacterized protein n=1 Tax=Peptoniphilus harei TaxID=54005 RepID=A0A133PR35_9FIRM|nr:hypothetical protein HMPREF3229_00514 [Peptoniphilus harei]